MEWKNRKLKYACIERFIKFVFNMINHILNKQGGEHV